MQFLIIFNNFNDFYDFWWLCQNDESMCQICDTLIDSTPYVSFNDLYGPVTSWSQVSRPEKPWKLMHRLCRNDKIDDFDDFDYPEIVIWQCHIVKIVILTDFSWPLKIMKI